MIQVHKLLQKKYRVHVKLQAADWYREETGREFVYSMWTACSEEQRDRLLNETFPDHYGEDLLDSWVEEEFVPATGEFYLPDLD